MAETLITDRRSASAHYKILRKLGKGGMAEVFLARQEGMAGFRRLTVVKKLLPQFSQMADVAEMLLDEARIAAQLTHPNIVQIFELGKEEGQYFIVMEFVDGCDLATLARIERHRKGRVPLRLTLRAVSEAAMGLDYAHRQTGLDGRPLNIVHRDVSPHNIMCSREGAVKVTDFGIAKAVGKAQVTQVGVVKGKVQYMSPEQYTGGPVDHRSDIYSLGVVLYQLSTGRLPRVGEDGEVVMRRVLEGKVPRPSEVRPDYPEELEVIVMRALAHNAEDRYPDAASLRDDLLEFARENDLLAFPKDLGDYVNAQVPPVPLVVREQSHFDAAAPDPAAGPAQAPAGAVSGPLPSVMVEGEELDTEAPSGTEPASPSAQRRSAVVDRHTGPFDRTHPSVRLVPAPTPRAEERSTPSVVTPVLSAAVPTPRPAPLRERAAHLSGPDPEPPRPALAPAGAQPVPDQTATSTPTVTPSTATQPIATRPSARPLLLVAAISGVVALAAVVFGLLAIGKPGDPVSRRPSEGAAAGAGVINVLSNPSNAAVSIDGAVRCPSTPCQVAGLPLNRELLITMRAHGYTLWMQRLVLTPSEPKLLLRADLSPEQPGSAADPQRPVKAERDPATGARKNGQKSGGKSAKVGRVVDGPPRKAGKVKSTGKVITVDIEEEQAVLTVDVRPWAEVWIDGQKLGHTPLQVAVPPGKHKVQLRNDELGYNKTYTIRSQLKKKVKISEALQPPPGAGE